MKRQDFHAYMELQRKQILCERDKLGFWLKHWRRPVDNNELAEWWIKLNGEAFAKEHGHE